MQNANKPWFVSGFSTAAGIIVEFRPDQSADWGKTRDYKLRGFAVSGSTALAISTNPIKLIYGKSSAAELTTIVLTAEPGAGMLGAAQLMGLEGGYFAIESTVAHADGGLTVFMWGD